jgi:hypothetical protein
VRRHIQTFKLNLTYTMAEGDAQGPIRSSRAAVTRAAIAGVVSG